MIPALIFMASSLRRNHFIWRIYGSRKNRTLWIA